MERRFARRYFGVYEIDLDAGELRKNGKPAATVGAQTAHLIGRVLLLRPAGALSARILGDRGGWISTSAGIPSLLCSLRIMLSESGRSPLITSYTRVRWPMTPIKALLVFALLLKSKLNGINGSRQIDAGNSSNPIGGLTPCLLHCSDSLRTFVNCQ